MPTPQGVQGGALFYCWKTASRSVYLQWVAPSRLRLVYQAADLHLFVEWIIRLSLLLPCGLFCWGWVLLFFFFFLNGQFSWEKPLRSDYLGHHNLKRKAQNACTMFPNISLTSKLNYESQKLFCCVTILRKAAPEYLLVMFRTFQIQLPLNRALTMSLCLL